MSALREEFVGRCQLKGLAKKTIITYTYAVASLSRFLKRSPLECSTAEIRKFCLHEVNERKLSPRTVNLEIKALKSKRSTKVSHLAGRLSAGLTNHHQCFEG